MPSKDKEGRIELPCKEHPDAPHGFNRNASHSEARYVCDCEGWFPDEPDVKKMTIVESIVSRDLPAEIIFEDDLIIAFMDIRPINRGHTLICPKLPYPDFVSVPEDVLLCIFRVAKKIYNNLTEKYAPDGIGFLQNNGAFNELDHYHLHIYPCHKDKGGRLRIETIGKRSPKQLAVDAQELFIPHNKLK